MKTQRLTMAALVLLAALCAAACSQPAPSDGSGRTEESGSATPSPTQPAEQADPGAAQQAAGYDPVNPENAARSQKQPFMVLIKSGNCGPCERLQEAMKGLRGQGESRTLFFVLNTDDEEKLKADAKSLDVGLGDRTKVLPWAAVFEAGAKNPRPQPQIAGVKTDEEVKEAADKLRAEATAVVAAPRGGGDGGDVYTKEEVTNLLNALKANLVKDPAFRKSLLEDEAFKADVSKSLSGDDKFKAELVAGLAGNEGFQPRVKSSPVGARAAFAFMALGIIPLLALALGLWNFRELRRVELHASEEGDSPAASQDYHRKRERRYRRAVKGVVRKLRSEVAGVGERVRRIDEANVAVRADAEKTALSALGGVVTVLSSTQAVTQSPEIDAMAMNLLGVIDGRVGALRLEVGNRLEALENKPPAVVNTPPFVGVTKEQLKVELNQTSGDLSVTIEGLRGSLEEKIESARKTLDEKIDDEISAVRADFGINGLMGGAPVAGNENGRGEGAPALHVTPQGDGHVTRPVEDEQKALAERLAEERTRLELRLANAEGILGELDGLRGHVPTLVGLEPRVQSLEAAPPKASPGVEALSHEVAGLRQLFETGEGQRRQVLESKLDRQEFERKVGGLERQLGKSRRQMAKLIKRLMQMLRGSARETSELRREVRDDLGPRLGQRAEQSEGRQEAIEKSLQDLVDNWRPDVLDVPKLREAARATARTVAEVVRRLLDAQEAKMAARLPADGEGQAAAARTLEKYQEQLHGLAAKVAPLVEGMAALTASALKLSPETGSDLAEFQDEAAEFERLERLVGEQLMRLSGNSARNFYEGFRAEREKLEGRLRDGVASTDQFANASLALLDVYTAEDPDGPAAPDAADEEEIKALVSGAEDRLMDWYSNFFQLYTRMQESRRAGGAIDEAFIREAWRVLKVAREVLSRFDIQPEEIVIGQTLYDGRLHDFAVARESSYPTQTIIEVWKSGFRRMRDGATLRRPQVVVAGTGVVTGAT